MRTKHAREIRKEIQAGRKMIRTTSLYWAGYLSVSVLSTVYEVDMMDCSNRLSRKAACQTHETWMRKAR